MDNKMKESEVRFKINLDEANVPVDMKWMATDSRDHELRDCKCVMISIWDAGYNQTMKIDLWTKDMTTDEMHSHYFQTLLSLTESYVRATGNPLAISEMKKFAEDLAKKTSDWENTKD